MDIVVMIKRGGHKQPGVKLAPEMQFCVMPIVNRKAGKLLQIKGLSSMPWPSTDDSWCWTHTTTLAGLQ